MIPHPICVIMGCMTSIFISMLGIAISIAGWFVVHGLAKKRDEQTRTVAAKIEFRLFVSILTGNIPARDIDSFYNETKPELKNAIVKVGLFLKKQTAARLNDLWGKYDAIIPHTELSNEQETGALANFDKKFDENHIKPSEKLKDFFEMFSAIASE